MTPIPVSLAVPGDIQTLTGGYVYDRNLFDALGQAGHAMSLITLPASFPFPPPDDMAQACALLAAVPAGQIVIVDGLAFGALPTAQVAQMTARIIALVHHPLAYESNLADDARAHLLATERANLRFAAQVLVPSPHTKETLVTHYGVDPARIHVATPGITQQPGAQPDTPRLSPPLILSVGILDPRKGHDVLIDALKQIERLEWTACIVGRAWEKGYGETLQAQIDQHGLGARVRLAGQQTQAQLAGLYAQASIFALATRYEGYGIVFSEALVHGLPIVSCATGAVPDTVPPSAGLLTACDDPGAFGAALARLLTDPALARDMGQAALAAGQALGTWADTARVASRAIAAAAGGRG